MTGKLIAVLGEEKVLIDRPLKDYTTFRVGGPAKAVAVLENEDELKKAVKILTEENEKYFIIGNGSNLLVSDEGYDGIVLKLSGEFTDIRIEGEKITAGAGCILSKVCRAALDAGLSGLEFAYGIPGTVGGAMVMNAGAYDGEMKLVVNAVRVLTKDGTVKLLSNEEMAFGYRDSILKHDELIVLSAEFMLKRGETASIKEKMDDFMERRRSK